MNETTGRPGRSIGLLAILLLLAASPAAAWPTNVAFRGGVVLGPENTLATYDLTLLGGGEWLEMDVWISADGVPVCHHDETLDRTTDGTGIIWQKTLAELKTLDAGSWFDPAFAGEQIPTLEEALALVRGRGKVLLDIKDNDYIDEIDQVVTDSGFPPEDVFGWIRAGEGMMTNFKTLMAQSEGFLSTKGPLYVPEEMIWERTQADDRPDYGLIAAFKWLDGNPEWVELVHSYGLRVFAASVLSPEFLDAFDLDVDGLIAANPTLLATFLPLPDPQCSDGVDNDGDGNFDYPDDPGCWGPEDLAEAAACSDGNDNDGDGLTDYPNDPGCFAAFYDYEAPACNDGIDNNADGLTDYPDDPGCFGAFDQREGLPCNDGKDNDGDGLVDFPDDPGCDDVNDLDECGALDCDDPCGDCDAGLVCDPTGTCCTPQCDGKQCGDDGCGGTCGTCEEYETCDASGSCVCFPDCTGLECGDDGCAGSCGSCSGTDVCEAGLCVPCTPQCTGKECGDDGCGGSCGACGIGETCDPAGSCLPCVPQCAGKECGDDGCGGSCGSCDANEACDLSGACVCVPNCVELECGDDGCGGSCGSCVDDDICDVTTQECCSPDTDEDSVCNQNDCAPNNQHIFGSPTEISNLRMPDADTLEWDSDAPYSGAGTTYDVIRGVLDELPVGGPSEVCIVSGTSATTLDISVPLLPAGYYFLVRGSNECAVGTYGYDSQVVERVSGACP